MPVSSDQVAKGFYFWLDGRRESIWEIHFPRLNELLKLLNPIAINGDELTALGFEKRGESEYIKHGWSFTMSCKQQEFNYQKSNYWQIAFDNQPTRIQIAYIHEVQRMWFIMTKDILRYRSASSLPGQPGYTPKDHYSLSANLRWLSRHPRHAIWEIAEDNYPVVQIHDHIFGIKLVAGRNVTDAETKTALDWLTDFIKCKIQ